MVTTLESSAILKQLREINNHLQEQALEMTAARAELDIQNKRISELQAQLDALPANRRRRQAIGLLASQSRPSRNGNGRSQ
jgi:hypothetical protein